MAGNNGRSLHISPSCHTLSKAWLMSRNAAVQYLWFSSASVICISDTVDLFDSSAFLSETKLVIRYSPLFVEEWLKSSQEEFPK